MRPLIIFGCGVLFAASLNQLRWSIWPLSGGPYVQRPTATNPDGIQLFGWLGGPPGYGRPIGQVYSVAR